MVGCVVGRTSRPPAFVPPCLFLFQTAAFARDCVVIRRPPLESASILLHAQGVKSLALIILLALAPVLTGCSWTDHAGTHTLVLGLGIVSTRQAAAPPLASLQRTRAAGVLATPDGLVIGLLDRATLTVAPTAQVLAQATALRSGHNTLIVSPVLPPSGLLPCPPRTTQESHPCLASFPPRCLLP